MRISGSTALWVIALSAYGVFPAAAQGIGVASAVQNDVTGTRDGATKPLSTGNSIFQNQVIATGSESAAQLLFLDETSLSIGPNSDVTLDKFVFDPNRRTGQLVLETGRGLFRFVTGSSDPTGYRLKTPAATIGFRGSIVDIVGDPLTIICVEATITITDVNGNTIVLDTPGQAVRVNPDGTLSDPFTWDGNYDTVVGAFPFPLYADGFLEDPRGFDIPDGKIQILDQTNGEFPQPEVGCYPG